MRRAAWPLSVAIAARTAQAHRRGGRAAGLRGGRFRRQRRRRTVGGDLPAPPRCGRRRDPAQPRTHTCRSPRGIPCAGGRKSKRISATTDLVIDGVVGISGAGPLRPAAAAVFADNVAPVVAVDIPSGVDVADRSRHGTGRAGRRDRHVRRAQTRTRTGRLRSRRTRRHRVGPAAHRPARLRGGRRRRPLAGARARDDKYTQGVTGVVAGSATYPGAAILCTGAAVAAHSGMVRYVGSAAAEVVSHWPEVIAVTDFADAGRVQAWVVGSGLRHRPRGVGHAAGRAGHRPAGDRRRRRTDHPGQPSGPGAGPVGADGADPACRRVRTPGRTPAG